MDISLVIRRRLTSLDWSGGDPSDRILHFAVVDLGEGPPAPGRTETKKLSFSLPPLIA